MSSSRPRRSAAVAGRMRMIQAVQEEIREQQKEFKHEQKKKQLEQKEVKEGEVVLIGDTDSEDDSTPIDMTAFIESKVAEEKQSGKKRKKGRTDDSESEAEISLNGSNDDDESNSENEFSVEEGESSDIDQQEEEELDEMDDEDKRKRRHRKSSAVDPNSDLPVLNEMADVLYGEENYLHRRFKPTALQQDDIPLLFAFAQMSLSTFAFPPSNVDFPLQSYFHPSSSSLSLIIDSESISLPALTATRHQYKLPKSKSHIKPKKPKKEPKPVESKPDKPPKPKREPKYTPEEARERMRQYQLEYRLKHSNKKKKGRSVPNGRQQQWTTLQPSSSWDCYECTFHNHHLAKKCKMCGIDKTESEAKRSQQQPEEKKEEN